MNNKEKVQEFNKLIKDMGLKSYADPTSTPGRFIMTNLFQFEYVSRYYRMTVYPNGVCVVTQYLDLDSEPNQMVTYDSAEQLKKVCQLMGKVIPIKDSDTSESLFRIEMEKIGNPVEDLPPTAWRGPCLLEDPWNPRKFYMMNPPSVWHGVTPPPETLVSKDSVTTTDIKINTRCGGFNPPTDIDTGMFQYHPESEPRYDASTEVQCKDVHGNIHLTSEKGI